MKKKILLLPGIRDIKSIQAAGISSIPKSLRSTYLELYTLQRQKDRLEKEMYVLEKRDTSAKGQIGNINRRMEGLHKEATKWLRDNPYKKLPSRALKTMTIKY